MREGRDGPCLLEMRGIEKAFLGVQALSEVDLSLDRGEVLALLGENGAGKSTLIKVLAGACLPDAGRILLEGKETAITTPEAGQRAGISVIYQELNIIPSLTVRENITLGRETARGGWIARSRERRSVQKLFADIGVAIDAEAICSELTVAEQQMVEIAKALAIEARILVMDEPTAALSNREVERLFAIIRDLRARGLGIIYISHRLDEIARVADRVMVLRDGRAVATRPMAGVSRTALIEMMVGRTIENEFPPRERRIGPVRLVVSDLRNGDRVKGVSLSARGGEVVGLGGLVGSGRTETLRAIFGADHEASGSIELDGRRLEIRRPIDAIRNRIGMVTEDRKNDGLVFALSARENFGLPNLRSFSSGGIIDAAKERVAFARMCRELRIKVADGALPVGGLSGGNQQKIVLAKWLERRCEVLLFDEPTRGVDVGAKYEIYQMINALAGEGKVVIVVSSELPELLGLCDRIVVMHDGRVTGVIEDVARATQEDIMHLAVA